MTTADLVSVVSQQAARLVQILNESLHPANDSKSIKTRVSRLTPAKDKLAELQALAQQCTFLSLTSLPEVLKWPSSPYSVYQGWQVSEEERHEYRPQIVQANGGQEAVYKEGALEEGDA